MKIIKNLVPSFFKNLSILALVFLFSCTKSSFQKEVVNAENVNKPNSPLALCKNPFYRYWSGSDGDHYYTTVQGNYSNYVYEKIECTVISCPQGNWKPFYKYYNGSSADHYYTTVLGSYSGYI